MHVIKALLYVSLVSGLPPRVVISLVLAFRWSCCDSRLICAEEVFLAIRLREGEVAFRQSLVRRLGEDFRLLVLFYNHGGL